MTFGVSSRRDAICSPSALSNDAIMAALFTHRAIWLPRVRPLSRYTSRGGMSSNCARATLTLVMSSAASPAAAIAAVIIRRHGTLAVVLAMSMVADFLIHGLHLSPHAGRGSGTAAANAYWGSANTYTAFPPATVSASGVTRRADTLDQPPAAMAMYSPPFAAYV